MQRILLRRVVYVTLVAFAISASLGVGVNRWYAHDRIEVERSHVRAQLLLLANSVAAAVGRHVSRMSGLAAFVHSRTDMAQLDREFALFSAGLMANTPGIRAVQMVRNGRIEKVYPLEGNARVVGLNLRESPSAATRAGYQRALASDGVTVFGPATLVQGGTALVIDQRLHASYDRQLDFVAMLVDMRSIVQDLRLEETPSEYVVAVLDASGGLVGSSSIALPDAAERVVAEVRDGNWTVVGAPAVGWNAAVAGQVFAVRIATLVIVLLLTALAWQMADRDTRLTRKVEARTASLMQLAEERRETIRRQEQTETALAASEDRLRRALSASHTATYELDLATGRMTWSEGVGPVVGRPAGTQPDSLDEALDYVDPAYRSRVTSAFAAAGVGPAQGAFEVRAPREDGGVTWLALTWASDADKDGVVRRVVGTMTDISERKHLEEQFLHAQKMQAMGALAGGVAHDFNNLLTIILGAGHMARATANAPGVVESLRTDLDEVLAAGERASVLTGQLLAFSRRQVVQPRHFDACDLVSGMSTMLRRLVGERIRVETALPGVRVPLFADQGQITQVVMNLAVNARDAMPQGGVLRINLRVDGPPSGTPLPDEVLTADRYAVLSVSDTGSGIEMAIRHLIFDPFFTTKPVGQGTGLGLSTVYGIVMQCGGTLRLTSEPGEGTVFEVYLPLVTKGDDAAPVVRAASTQSDGTGRSVLLVEDEAGLRRLIERVLADAGYVVMVAQDGLAALALSRAHAAGIDLLVSDVVMPGLSGLELARVLQAERPEMRILLMSGYPREGGRPSEVLLSDVPFIAKPFKPSELLVACRRALAEA